MSRLDSEGRVILDPDPTPTERALAVVHCGLCDDDGYRGTVVCDHVDHTGAAQRGMALIRGTLGTRDTSEAGSVAPRANETAKGGS